MSKSSFAHLLSSTILGKSKNAAKEVDENEEEHAEAPDNDKEDGKKAGGKKAAKKSAGEGEKDDKDEDKESDEGEKDEEKSDDEEKEEENEEDKEDKKRGKKGKKASADMSRARAIMASPHAAGQPDLAAHLAFDTDMSVAEAENRMIMMNMQKTIDAGSKPRRVSLDERMISVKNPNVGADAMPEQPGNTIANSGVTLQQLEKMSPDQRALQIVNAGRLSAGLAPLKALANPNRAA